jgi:hypothetical protein
VSKICFQIPYPAFIESIVVYFLLRYRKKHYGIAFRRIKLTKDKFAIVDPDDYQKLSQYPWQIWETERNSCYAVRYCGKKIIYMHRQIMNAPAGSIVDHRNRESLDNTKRNLHFATISQNNMNCKKRSKPASSKYKGVSWSKGHNKWQAYIAYNGKRKHLGYFDNEEDAARAYDEAAKIYHGQFAVLNFDDNSEPAQIPKPNNIINSLAKWAGWG